MPKPVKEMADYILPLNINGLQGRMLRMPPPKGKKLEILFIYGHHASIERHFGVAEFLNRYGAVTMPDLPGFGGMDPFYKIGSKPTLDNMADYLASFIKLRYKNKRFAVGGYSLGVMLITRMLQKYPEIAKRVDMVSSIAGFVHSDDFGFKRRNFLIMKYGTGFLSLRLPAAVAKHLFINAPFIKFLYFLGEKVSFNAKTATLNDRDNRAERIAFEVELWKMNELRTYMAMGHTMFTLDLTSEHVDLPIYHATISNDHYFNDIRVEQHMRMIFNEFHVDKISSPTHSPSVVATAKDAALFIPVSFRKVLNKLN